MFTIDNNKNIKLTRGDTAVISIELHNKDGTEYELQQGDILLFTVKENVLTKKILIQKTFSDKQIKIKPTDTDDLPYGIYHYDVQLTTASGDVFTVITPHKIEIESEVTWAE